MNPAESSSLFHFTHTFDVLKKILIDGVRFSYSIEFLPKELSYNCLNTNAPTECVDLEHFSMTNYTGVGIPMICFCDIPLTRAKFHSQNYGKYAIGYNKEFAQEIFKGLNPVYYLSSDKIINAFIYLSMLKAEKLKESNTNNNSLSDSNSNGTMVFNASDGKQRNFFVRNSIDSINRLIAFAKLYKREDKASRKGFEYYKEHEWRICYLDYENDITNWIWDCKSKEDLIEPNTRLHKSNNAYASFKTDYKEVSLYIISHLISHIIVRYESQVIRLADKISKMNSFMGIPLNKTDDKKIRNFLISRISSFEQIEKDY